MILEEATEEMSQHSNKIVKLPLTLSIPGSFYVSCYLGKESYEGCRRHLRKIKEGNGLCGSRSRRMDTNLSYGPHSFNPPHENLGKKIKTSATVIYRGY